MKLSLFGSDCQPQQTFLLYRAPMDDSYRLEDDQFKCDHNEPPSGGSVQSPTHVYQNVMSSGCQ